MSLDKEFEFYKSQQEELVKQYLGKFLIIKDQKVVGSFDTKLEAYNDGVKNYGLGNFLLQECLPGEDNYTQTFHSRVSLV